MRDREYPPGLGGSIEVATDLDGRGYSIYSAVAGDAGVDFICGEGSARFTVSLVEGTGADHVASIEDGVITYTPALS